MASYHGSKDYNLTRSGEPAALISLDDAKAHLRYEDDDQDDYINGLVGAVNDFMDGPYGVLGKAITSQTWSLMHPPVSGGAVLIIPLFPLISVTSIKYYDADNEIQTADNTDFVIFGNNDKAYIEPLTAWPAMYDRPDAIDIVFVAGFATVPKGIIHAAKLLLGHWFENRESVTETSTNEVPQAFQNLIDVHRTGWVKS
ncbi:head-tail connector protein [Lentilitoribacter sp. EG35]|uniref:head-tail connector protein n=1 Tax=Lentilitoribacter sp. EG35 TaxID=3234192 RepID=UPI003460A9C9